MRLVDLTHFRLVKLNSSLQLVHRPSFIFNTMSLINRINWNFIWFNGSLNVFDMNGLREPNSGSRMDRMRKWNENGMKPRERKTWIHAAKIDIQQGEEKVFAVSKSFGQRCHLYKFWLFYFGDLKIELKKIIKEQVVIATMINTRIRTLDVKNRAFQIVYQIFIIYYKAA